jgi:hypothetical protein
MIVVAVCALFLRYGIVKLIESNIAQNDSDASSIVKLVSQAIENYARDNQGVYPTDFSLLTKPKPPYLDKNYIVQSPLKGYNYTCSRLEASGYSCTAVPVKCRLTGKMIYTVSTGGLFVSEECNRKE